MRPKTVGSGYNIGDDILAFFEIDPVVGPELQAELLLFLPRIWTNLRRKPRDRNIDDVPIAITRRPIYFAYWIAA